MRSISRTAPLDCEVGPPRDGRARHGLATVGIGHERDRSPSPAARVPTAGRAPRLLRLAEDLVDAADIRRDDGQAERQGFEHRDRKPLVVRREAEEVERRHDAHRVGAVAGEQETITEAAFDVERAELGLQSGLDRPRRTARSELRRRRSARPRADRGIPWCAGGSRPYRRRCRRRPMPSSARTASARAGWRRRAPRRRRRRTAATAYARSQPGRHRVAHRARHRDGEIVEADRQRVGTAGQRLVTRPDVVLRGHETRVGPGAAACGRRGGRPRRRAASATCTTSTGSARSRARRRRMPPEVPRAPGTSRQVASTPRSASAPTRASF